MAWKFYGDRILTADLGTTEAGQRFNPNKDIFLKAIGMWLVDHDATFTTLNLKIFANRAGTLAGLIATSTNSVASTGIATSLAFAIRRVFFQFDNIPLKGTDDYWMVLNPSGYTGNATNFIAWQKDWPDPINPTGFSSTFENLMIAPRNYDIVASEI